MNRAITATPAPKAPNIVSIFIDPASVAADESKTNGSDDVSGGVLGVVLTIVVDGVVSAEVGVGVEFVFEVLAFPKVESGMERRNGGEYSNWLVKSSVILIPYT
jgi:hypothetical protein